MKKLLLMAIICLLASANQVNAQLIIRNNGHVEIGHDPYDPVPEGLPSSYYHWLDTATVLKVFGTRGDAAAGGHMTFGDNLLINNYNVAIGELGFTDTDKLWLQGKFGAYLTAGSMATDTIMCYDTANSSFVQFNRDVHTSGVFLQSDERFKENIEPVGDVLPALDRLEPVTYTLKNERAVKCLESLADMPVVTDKDSRDKAFFEKLYAEQAKGSERYGFLAQNVKEVFPELVHTDNAGNMYVDYIGLIPILVQSINELKAELAEVKGENTQEEEGSVMKAPQQASQSDVEADLTAPKLYQNAPNPWSSETVIRYRLPQSVANACIYIYDMQGTQLKSIPAQGRGETQVTLTAHDLNAGMYIYALVADGALIDSKQMIITK